MCGCLHMCRFCMHEIFLSTVYIHAHNKVSATHSMCVCMQVHEYMLGVALWCFGMKSCMYVVQAKAIGRDDTQKRFSWSSINTWHLAGVKVVARLALHCIHIVHIHTLRHWNIMRISDCHAQTWLMGSLRLMNDSFVGSTTRQYISFTRMAYVYTLFVLHAHMYSEAQNQCSDVECEFIRIFNWNSK